MSIHGRILVTTSHIGCAICIWDMKKGQLLKRHEYNWEDEEPTAMVYLKHMNGYLCSIGFPTTGCLKTWSFPTNQMQSEKAVSVLHRLAEESLRTLLAG